MTEVVIHELDTRLLGILENILRRQRWQIEQAEPGEERFHKYAYANLLALHRSILSSHFRDVEVGQSRKSLYRDRRRWKDLSGSVDDSYEALIYDSIMSIFAFYEQMMPDYKATILAMSIGLYYLELALENEEDPLLLDEDVTGTELEERMRAVQRVIVRWGDSYPAIMLSGEVGHEA